MKVIALVLVICLLAASVAMGAQEIRIGGLFALSGKAAQIGIATKNVATMVVDDINKSGGINGAKIKLFIQERAPNPARLPSRSRNWSSRTR